MTTPGDHIETFRVPILARLVEIIVAPLLISGLTLALGALAMTIVFVATGFPGSPPAALTLALIFAGSVGVLLFVWCALRNPHVEIDWSSRVLRARGMTWWSGPVPRFGPVTIPLDNIDRVRSTGHGALLNITIHARGVRVTTPAWLTRRYELARMLREIAEANRLAPPIDVPPADRS